MTEPPLSPTPATPAAGRAAAVAATLPETPPDMPALPSGLVAPRALLFDWDNTLVDTWPCIHHVVNILMEHMGQPLWTFEETQQRIGRSMRDTFPAMFGERWEEAREVFLTAFQTVHLDMLAVLDGMEPMLHALAARGVPMGLVSNKTGHLLRREVSALGWDALFFAQVGAGDAARDKPARDAVKMALAQARSDAAEGNGGDGGLSPGPQVWLIGDSATDMGCAHACGLTPVLLRDRDPNPAEFDGCPPLVHLRRGDHLVTAVDAVRRGAV